MKGISINRAAYSLLASASVIALFAAQPAAAAAAASDTSQGASAVGEVVVTAQRREERSVNVPVTVVSVNAAQLKDAGIQHLGDLQQLASGLHLSLQGTYYQPVIRGIGSDVLSAGAGANVATYVDGFYQPSPISGNTDLVNIQSVQVLEGPQGTLFGHNATGGAILITTPPPSADRHGMVDASYGNYNTMRYEAYFTTGLGDRVAADIGGYFEKSDGYLHDIVTGSDTDGAYEKWMVRLGLKVKLTDNISALLRYTHSENNDASDDMFTAWVGPLVGGGSAPWVNTYAPYATAPHQVANQGGSVFHQVSNTIQLTTTADWDFATLTSYTQWSRMNSGADGFDIGVNFLPLTLHNFGEQTITQEFVLNSKGSGPLKWTVGAFYMDWVDPFSDAGAGPPALSYSDSVSLALYADATYELAHNLFLSAGVRYSHDELLDQLSTTAGETFPNIEEDHATPRAVLRYAVSDNSSVYFSFSEGFKAGFYNLANLKPGTLASDVAVQPESIDAYEVGYKYARHGLSLSLSSYYYDYTNLQVEETRATGSGAGSFTLNAASARLYGLEGQANYNITPQLNVDGGFTLSHARYLTFTGAPVFSPCYEHSSPCPGGGPILATVGTNLTNAQMLQAPEFTATLGARYTTPLAGGDLALSTHIYYTSSVSYDLADEIRQNAYVLVGLRGEWTDPSHRFTVAVYGNNITNTNYYASYQLTGLGAGVTWGAPATYGGQITVKF